MTRNNQSRALRMLEQASRVLLCGIFVSAGIDKLKHRKGNQLYMKSKKMPAAATPSLLNGAIAVELVVAPALALGLAPRVTAPLLAAFLVPTSIVFHDFWNLQGLERKLQAFNFFKNMAIIGGLFGIVLNEQRKQVAVRFSEGIGQSSIPEAPRPDYLDLGVSQSSWEEVQFPARVAAR